MQDTHAGADQVRKLLAPISNEIIDGVPRVQMTLAALRQQQFCGIPLGSLEESAEELELEAKLIIGAMRDGNGLRAVAADGSTRSR